MNTQAKGSETSADTAPHRCRTCALALALEAIEAIIEAMEAEGISAYRWRQTARIALQRAQKHESSSNP